MVTLVLLCVFSQATSAARAERLLLAVGSSHGLTHEWPLSFAVQDAERFARVMVDLGGVSADSARVLRDPTLAEIVQALRELARLASPSATLLFYYSGHGGDSALHVRGEILQSRALRGEVARIPGALQLLIIDACRGSEARKGFVQAKPIDVSLETAPEHRGVVVLYAAGSGEAALESNRLQSGVFSHYLRSALRGAGDRDGDGRVSLSEAYDHAYSGTLQASAGSSELLQHPTLDLELRGVGPLVLTRITPARSVLRLPPAHDEHYVIFMKGSGAAYAEAWSRPAQPTLVALPAGQFVVYRRSAAGHAALELNLPFGGERQLGERDFTSVKPEEVAERGGNYTRYDDRLAMSVGGLVDGAGRFGAGASLHYARGAARFSPTLGAGFTRRDFRTSNYHAARQTLDLTPGVQYRVSLGSLSAVFGVGATASVLLQQLTPRTGLGLGRSRGAALGFGGLARIGLGMPCTSRLVWQLEAVGMSTLFREHMVVAAERKDRIRAEYKVVVASGPVVSF